MTIITKWILTHCVMGRHLLSESLMIVFLSLFSPVHLVVIMATEHHGKVKHLASFLILELVQVTKRQNHVTALTLQLLVVSLEQSF